MSVINTNYLSLVSQNNLNKSQSALGTAIERLSSGLRINSAKDDAAGQAIANRMTSQVKGLNQAQRNANDGISVAQTAEGALNQVNDNLQRIRELTVQSQNATNSGDDKASIQAEITQRLTEIDRISKETDFNGVKVLASDQNLKIQVGANDNEQISVGLKEINKTTLGLASFDVTKSLDAQPELGEQVGFNSTEGAIFQVKDASGTVRTDVFAAKADDGSLVAVKKLADAQSTAANGGYAAVTYVGGSTGAATGQKATLAFVAKDAANDDFSNGTVAILAKSGADTYNITAATGVLDSAATTDLANTAVAVAANKVVPSDDTSGAGVKLAVGGLSRLDSALKMVDTLRSDLGAIQNRFESAITNLQTNSTNLQAARSRIEDADYAVEVANMTKNQILQQAGTSVLAQANQIPQGVLSLLR